MNFTILNLTAAFAMLAATTSSVYASEDHTAVQSASLRGSRDISADEDSSTDEELFHIPDIEWTRNAHHSWEGHKENMERARQGIDTSTGSCCTPSGDVCPPPYHPVEIFGTSLGICCHNTHDIPINADVTVCGAPRENSQEGDSMME